MEAIDRANGLLAQYARLALAELPQDARVFDAHTHLGEDIDGMVGDRDELLAIQRAYSIDRSFVFCLDEPDRRPAFAAANDRTLAHAAAATAELLRSCGSISTRAPLRRRRGASTSAPAASSSTRAPSGSSPTTHASSPCSRSPRSGAFPILIHGGRGLPPIADSLARLLDRHAPPALIIAHAGIVDLAAMAENFAGRPGVFFDTSVWSPLDLLDLYRLVPPEQVVYASDYPYGRQPNSLLMAVRTARACGLDDRQLRAVLHDTGTRIADGLDPVAPGSPQGPSELSHPVTFLRIHQYLTMASAMLWLRHTTDTYGVVGLAINACDERSNGHRAETEQIRELLVATRDLWDLAARTEDELDRRRAQRGAFRLVHLASVLSVTTPG